MNSVHEKINKRLLRWGSQGVIFLNDQVTILMWTQHNWLSIIMIIIIHLYSTFLITHIFLIKGVRKQTHKHLYSKAVRENRQIMSTEAIPVICHQKRWLKLQNFSQWISQKSSLINSAKVTHVKNINSPLRWTFKTNSLDCGLIPCCTSSKEKI